MSEAKAPVLSRHLLSINDLSREQAILILDTADELSRVSDAPIKKLPTLRGRTVVNLFYEDSTRTRISFEAAAKRLSADVINFSAKGSSVSKGESLKDTALTLQSMGADAVILRHSASGAARRLAEWTEGSVINAGDGTHEHPTQALLDAFTIRKHLKASSENNAGLGLDLSGVKVAIVGDILHSRVARSNVLLLSLLGAKVTLVAPPTLLPVGVSDWPVDISYDFDSAIRNTDVVMMLRLQLERMKSAFFPSAREYSRLFGLDSERLAKGENSPLILHPGPINRGLEISSECADNVDSLILEQVKNGVSVRMAVLYLLLGGAD
jgi:aspartate carbamoyltransferase catalytic subunit